MQWQFSRDLDRNECNQGCKGRYGTSGVLPIAQPTLSHLAIEDSRSINKCQVQRWSQLIKVVAYAE